MDFIHQIYYDPFTKTMVDNMKILTLIKKRPAKKNTQNKIYYKINEANLMIWH